MISPGDFVASFLPLASRGRQAVLGFLFIVCLALISNWLLKKRPRHVRELAFHLCVAFGIVFVTWIYFRR